MRSPSKICFKLCYLPAERTPFLFTTTGIQLLDFSFGTQPLGRRKADDMRCSLLDWLSGGITSVTLSFSAVSVQQTAPKVSISLMTLRQKRTLNTDSFLPDFISLFSVLTVDFALIEQMAPLATSLRRRSDAHINRERLNLPRFGQNVTTEQRARESGGDLHK